MRSRWFTTFLLVALAAFGVAANVARAQTTGGIEGVVSDSSDNPLPGVTVTLKSTSLQGARTAVTSAAGRYRFPAIPPRHVHGDVHAHRLQDDREA